MASSRSGASLRGDAIARGRSLAASMCAAARQGNQLRRRRIVVTNARDVVRALEVAHAIGRHPTAVVHVSRAAVPDKHNARCPGLAHAPMFDVTRESASRGSAGPCD